MFAVVYIFLFFLITVLCLLLFLQVKRQAFSPQTIHGPDTAGQRDARHSLRKIGPSRLSLSIRCNFCDELRLFCGLLVLPLLWDLG